MDYSTLFNKPIRQCSINGEDIKDLLNLTFIDPDYYEYEIFRVPKEYIARPDLVCLDKYGTTNNVDVICKINGISNPFELNEGDLLIMPSTGSLSHFHYTGDHIDYTDNTTGQNPVPKKRNEKRKANEAVIGDTRFRIDKTRGVVIY